MAWVKTLALVLITACASCKPSLRAIDICRLYPGEGSASCAKGDKKYELDFPTKMVGWYAFHEQSLELLGARLEECEQRGRLPSGDDTWNEMNTCVIGLENCGGAGLDELTDHLAVTKSGAGKIRQRLEYCTR